MMGVRKFVSADVDVRKGDRVAIRGCRATINPRFANAVVISDPWRGETVIPAGMSFTVEMAIPESLNLQAIADGPIMDSNQIYLPAGKLSIAETRAREAAQVIKEPAA